MYNFNRFIVYKFSVAISAAIQAATLEQRENAPRIFLKCVTPLSLGVISDGKVRSVIKRSTAYPTEVTRKCQTGADNQPEMCISIYEGEQTDSKLSTYLGRMVLKGIDAAPKGEGKCEITLKLNRIGEISL